MGDAQSRHDALIFAACLMGILLAHEMGHWTVARYHGFEQSLPVFIPVPFGFGTMGAVIRLRSMPPSRTALLEMGAAGPLSGAIVAFMLLAWALPLGKSAVNLPSGAMVTIFNDPLAVKLLGILTMGEIPGRYSEYHPAAMAGWVGCFLTGVNLIPTGQLDGGHVLNALLPQTAARMSRYIPLAMISVGLLGGAFSYWQGALQPASMSWIVWGSIIRFMGADRPLPVPHLPLSLRAKVIAFLIAILFILTFMPMPMEVETLP